MILSVFIQIQVILGHLRHFLSSKSLISMDQNYSFFLTRSFSDRNYKIRSQVLRIDPLWSLNCVANGKIRRHRQQIVIPRALMELETSACVSAACTHYRLTCQCYAIQFSQMNIGAPDGMF